MRVIHVDNSPTKQECKCCLYCDIYANRCIKYNAPAYKTGGICLHKDCTDYKRNDGRVPDWYEFIEDDELDLTQQSVRGR